MKLTRAVCALDSKFAKDSTDRPMVSLFEAALALERSVLGRSKARVNPKAGAPERER
jgi:hypothetical protein